MFGFKKSTPVPTPPAGVPQVVDEALGMFGQFLGNVAHGVTAPPPAAAPSPAGPMADPVEAQLRVIVITPVDTRISQVPCEIDYMIHGAGFDSFAGKQTFPLPTAKWPFPGDDVPVVFDRSNPQHVVIQWDQFMTHPDDQRLHDDRLAQMLRDGGRVPPPIWPASGPPVPPAPATDTVSQLERLARLRDDGVLSPAEFDAEKQKLLDSK